MPRVRFQNTSISTLVLEVTFFDSTNTELKAPIQFVIPSRSSTTISFAGTRIKAPENTAKLLVVIKRGGNKPDETINLDFEHFFVKIRSDKTTITKIEKKIPEKKNVKFHSTLGPPAVEVEVTYLDKNDKRLDMVKFDLIGNKVISNLGKAKSKAPKGTKMLSAKIDRGRGLPIETITIPFTKGTKIVKIGLEISVVEG
jgi:hypothetical protein